MKPYKHIKSILQPIIRDALQVDFDYYDFGIDPRFEIYDGVPRDYLEDPCGYKESTKGFRKYHNIIYDQDNSSWYDYFDNEWKNAGEHKINFPSIIDHSFEPVWYKLDYALWERKYAKLHPWPVYEKLDTEWRFLQVKDLPIYVLHSEHDSADIQKLDDLGYRTVHWFSHAFLCSEYYFRMYSNLDIVKNYTARPIRSPWICANRLLRQHRTDFLEMLDLSKGCYSLLNPDPNGLTYTGPVPTNSFDCHKNHSAEINVEELTPWNTSFLHIVSETVWQEKIHFTEKVFKPVVLHQPFVVLQAPGSLTYLRSYGFKTFGAWWDESYDSIKDPQERMQAIANIVNWIGAKSVDELETMRMEMASVLEHNFRHFYENIPAICLNELSVGFTLTP
tara:strand:+ start:1712 stop:2884 length:1173 start_codon:yes stop_codon:yes gene_type:complete